MRVFLERGKQLLIPCLLMVISGTMSAHAVAVDTRFKLDSKTLKDISPPPKSGNSAPQRSKKPGKQVVKTGKEIILTVKPGDRIERLLMRDCGLTIEEVKPLVEKVRKRNKLLNIRRLYVGQEIILPSKMRCAYSGIAVKSAELPPVSASTDSVKDAATKPLQSGSPKGADKLESVVEETSDKVKTEVPKTVDETAVNPVTAPKPISAEGPKEAGEVVVNRIAMLKAIWGNIVPLRQETIKPLKFKAGNFSLSLDPARYPVFAAMDGSRIVIDEKNSIPSKYLPLIAEQEPTLQIVAETTANGKRFLASLLRSGRFHSVEEDSTLAFGSDPKLTVRADFKVERTAESIFKKDILLLNDADVLTSPAIYAYLKEAGFVLYEPFSTKHKPSPTKLNRLVQVRAKTQPEIVEAVLSALSLPLKRDQNLDVASPDDSGINLSITIERSFELNGKRYVILSSGEPAVEAISSILSSGGLRIVLIEAGDDFRTVVEKILTSIEISGLYGFHDLLPEETESNSLELSGILIAEREPDGGSLFITDREIDGTIRDIATENGYSVE